MVSDGFWVFAYGSLIWDPGIDFVERRRAVLRGYRRAFCMTSVVYRGTPEAPGLVLSLDRDPDASCSGIAYCVAPERSVVTLAYLRARELVSDSYQEARLPVELEGDGGTVEALAYVSNRAHVQYCGGMTLEAQAEVIARAAGSRGPNSDYLVNTVAGLEALGLHDADLVRLTGMVRDRLGAGAPMVPSP